MALEHALLVSLTERASSGYDLARRFDKSIGFFWNATHQQIYRVLKRMEEQGWVSAEAVAQEGRPDKKVYTVSDAGREELVRWIAEPIEIAPMRNELGVKLRAASLGDVPALTAEVKRHRDQHAHRLDLYRTFEKKDFSTPEEYTGWKLHQYLVLRGGIRVEEGFVDWCDEVLDALQRDTARSRASEPKGTQG
ncbi:PadR family transcriptional regulator [Nocardia huaxiensis]|uniref:PadR family transcriptional regulator n=1 Tax=Nocardia huaxiensis TaxID=2755382 RepID=A0A7D6V8R4_9NOCA|nr:PadR family transcriptional regulator [Nocardia huaxiensis]QLY30361.1 PadR family transcriptional regulator [Nocardia huaxiensis]UFS96002.1 PadR family transcriptional regulator [Nocardia huaxiensis]